MKRGFIIFLISFLTTFSVFAENVSLVEKNETIIDAAKRELFEETGIKSVTHVYTEETPIRYDFS